MGKREHSTAAHQLYLKLRPYLKPPL
ncbi:hypothetical protein LINPERPRIM_LOCUS16869 [Linum perenne]